MSKPAQNSKNLPAWPHDVIVSARLAAIKTMNPTERENWRVAIVSGDFDHLGSVQAAAWAIWQLKGDDE